MTPAEQSLISQLLNKGTVLHPVGSFLFGAVGFSVFVVLLRGVDRVLGPGLGDPIFEGSIVGIPILVGVFAVGYLELTGVKPDSFIGWMAVGTVTGIVVGLVALYASVATYMHLHPGGLILFALLFIGVPTFMVLLYSLWPKLRS